MSHTRVRGNAFKLKEGNFRQDVRKTLFFTMIVVKHQNRLSVDIRVVPFLETFRIGLDGALKNMF